MEPLLKENVIKPAASFQKFLGNRMTITEFQNIDETIMFMEEEEIKLFGKLRKVRRLYIRPANSDFVGVGWIINEDITVCMVCGESFGLFRWPHHCRSCGNLVCHACSPEVVKIEELRELGEVRVCTQCYWGQSPIHVTHMRSPSIQRDGPKDYENEVEESKVEPVRVESGTAVLRISLLDKILITPIPFFTFFITRDLFEESSSNMNPSHVRFCFVNVCSHEVVEQYPTELKFVISEDIYTFRPDRNARVNQKDSAYEIYHVILRPDDASGENEEDFRPNAEAIVSTLNDNFSHRFGKKVTILNEQKYIGDTIEEIVLPPILGPKASKLAVAHHTIVQPQFSAKEALESIQYIEIEAKEGGGGSRTVSKSNDAAAEDTIIKRNSPMKVEANNETNDIRSKSDDKQRQRSAENKETVEENERLRVLAELSARKAAFEKAVEEKNDKSLDLSERQTGTLRPSSLAEDSIDTLFLPALTIEPKPASVIKTKRVDGRKTFVNICHHPLIPSLTDGNIYLDHPFYSDYLQLNFIQFTLNKGRHVMHVGIFREIEDKEGGTCLVSDVIMNTTILQDCLKDEELSDKIYLKALKALAKCNNTDFDAEYKLPKILKNYKGNEIIKLTIPAYSSVGRPLPDDTTRNSFRYNRSVNLQNNNSSIPTKLFGSVDTTLSSSKDGIAKDNRSPTAKSNDNQSPTAKTIDSGFQKSSSATSPVITSKAPSYFTINAELNRKWNKFLSPNANVVYTSVTTKKNIVGIKAVRQLILTDEPSLLYIDTSNMTLKGSIPWDPSIPPKPGVVDKQTFTIEVPGRTYKFVDLNQDAKTWVQKITAVVNNTTPTAR